MSLTIWTEFGPGYRTPQFFARIARCLSQTDIPTCYVVPNASAKRRAEVLCLSHGSDIFFGDRILTMSEWIKNLSVSHHPTLTDTQRLQIIRTLLKTIPLEYFRSSTTLSTCTLIARGITSALLAGLSPTQLHHLAKDYGQEREQDLAILFEAYLAQLDKDHWMDAAQIPNAALNALQNNTPIPVQSIIVEIGMAAAPILWKILRAFKDHSTPPDLHVIVPECHRSRAETELGAIAQGISPEEWVTVPSPPASLQLYRAPHPAAEYRWMAQHLQSPEASVLALNTDPTLWIEACMAEGLLKESAQPLSLATSPVSAPWFDTATWHRAPANATLDEWMSWWRNQLFPESQIQNLRKEISADGFACRTLRDIAQWESLWLHAAAATPAAQPLTAFELRTVIDPLLQTTAHLDADTLPYTPVALLSHLGDHIPNLLVLDATQSLLPNASGASQFFKSASILPQDPNARLLCDAFPSAETALQLQIAAWQRLSGSASNIMACYSISSDVLGEQFPSLLLDAEPQDIPISQSRAVTPMPCAMPETLLTATDTVAHVRQSMKAHTFSITELEDFAACPFRHFARYILGINVPDEESPEIPAKDEGRIIHRLLECFYRNPHIDLNDMFGDERAKTTRKILQGILTHEIQTTTPLQKIQIERLLESATHAVLFDLAMHDRLGDSALQPTHLEWSFGKGGVPPLTLRAANSDPIHIRGTVDRIDINPDTKHLLLIDYKYSETKPIIGKIQQGTHLQIPLYLLASQSVFADFTILGGLLFDLKMQIRTHGMAHKSAAGFLGIEGRPQSLTKEETWGELLQTAAAHAVHYAQQIRSGKTPIAEHTCEYCDWEGLLPWEE